MAMVSSIFRPFGKSSSAERRMRIGKSAPTALRVACTTSSTKRIRFSREPP